MTVDELKIKQIQDHPRMVEYLGQTNGELQGSFADENLPNLAIMKSVIPDNVDITNAYDVTEYLESVQNCFVHSIMTDLTLKSN